MGWEKIRKHDAPDPYLVPGYIVRVATETDGTASKEQNKRNQTKSNKIKSQGDKEKNVFFQNVTA